LIGYPDISNEVFSPLPVQPKEGELVDQTKKVTLEWSPVGYTNSFSLEVATDTTFNNKIVEEQSLSSTIFDLDTVQANTEYFWRVSATNNVGESEWSQTSSFVTTAPQITLLSPEEGVEWSIGLEYFITWEDNLSEEVVLDLFKGDSLVMMIDTTASTGGYKWNIPLFLDADDDYKIHIKSESNSDINDESTGFFSLADYSSSIKNDEFASMPRETALLQNFPNPFNSSTQITYQIKESGHVVLKLYNTLGAVVATLVDEQLSANSYTVNFDGKGLASGVYLYTLEMNGNLVSTKKMLIVK
jgi:hypothetical protein